MLLKTWLRGQAGTPSTAVAQQMFSSCAAHGGRGWDHSALVRALEMMAGHEISAA